MSLPNISHHCYSWLQGNLKYSTKRRWKLLQVQIYLDTESRVTSCMNLWTAWDSVFSLIDILTNLTNSKIVYGDSPDVNVLWQRLLVSKDQLHSTKTLQSDRDEASVYTYRDGANLLTLLKLPQGQPAAGFRNQVEKCGSRSSWKGTWSSNQIGDRIRPRLA